MRINLRPRPAWLPFFLLLGCSIASIAAAHPQAPQSQPAHSGCTASEQAPRAYALSPQRERQAIAYARAGHILYFADFAYSVVVLLLLLRWRVAARFRDWAERASRNRFAQALVFVPLLLLVLDVAGLPGGIAGHWLGRHFGQSIQGWDSWLWDRAKGDLVSAAVGIPLLWGLYAVIRRSPRRWWFYAWLASLPVLVFAVFLSPLVVEPLFFRFTPLADSYPELTAQLERVVLRGGQRIPESRMFLMNASEKLNALNAYVTGIGASKRVVVWDTTIARMNTPQILVVFGHEMGHYVLGHVPQGMAFAAGLLLAALWLGFYQARWLLRRYGAAWGVRGLQDWASLPALLLLLLALDFVGTPISNAFSRRLEHQADQYGLEVVHGIVADAPEVAAESFQILGDVDLAEPSPSRLVQIWFYTHPSIADRVRFACAYDPWGRGQTPRFVK